MGALLQATLVLPQRAAPLKKSTGGALTAAHCCTPLVFNPSNVGNFVSPKSKALKIQAFRSNITAI